MIVQLLAPVALMAGPMSAPAPADSFRATIVNRVVLDIAAPAKAIWTYLPGIRIRPNVERVSLNGLLDQLGARFEMIYRDSAGTITRHDRLDVLVWEPGVRYVARVSYLPPAAPTDIVYNVELRQSGGITHFVMDSYSAVELPAGGTAADRLARQVAAQESAQQFVVAGYTRLKAEIEAAARH